MATMSLGRSAAGQAAQYPRRKRKNAAARSGNRSMKGPEGDAGMERWDRRGRFDFNWRFERAQRRRRVTAARLATANGRSTDETQIRRSQLESQGRLVGKPERERARVREGLELRRGLRES